MQIATRVSAARHNYDITARLSQARLSPLGGAAHLLHTVTGQAEQLSVLGTFLQAGAIIVKVLLSLNSGEGENLGISDNGSVHTGVSGQLVVHMGVVLGAAHIERELLSQHATVHIPHLAVVGGLGGDGPVGRGCVDTVHVKTALLLVLGERRSQDAVQAVRSEVQGTRQIAVVEVNALIGARTVINALLLDVPVVVHLTRNSDSIGGVGECGGNIADKINGK